MGATTTLPVLQDLPVEILIRIASIIDPETAMHLSQMKPFREPLEFVRTDPLFIRASLRNFVNDRVPQFVEPPTVEQDRAATLALAELDWTSLGPVWCSELIRSRRFTAATLEVLCPSLFDVEARVVDFIARLPLQDPLPASVYQPTPNPTPIARGLMLAVDAWLEDGPETEGPGATSARVPIDHHGWAWLVMNDAVGPLSRLLDIKVAPLFLLEFRAFGPTTEQLYLSSALGIDSRRLLATLLILASRHGASNCLSHLLSRFPYLASALNSALIDAAAAGHAACLRRLLAPSPPHSPPADPAAHHNLALRNAAARGHARCVRILLRLRDTGVDPSDDAGSAVRLAASEGHAAVVRALLKDPRCEPALKGPDGKDAVCGAADAGYAGIVALLLAAGRGGDATKALKLAAAAGRVDVVRVLLRGRCRRGMRKRGGWVVDVTAENNAALRMAAANGHEVVVAMLLGLRRRKPAEGLFGFLRGAGEVLFGRGAFGAWPSEMVVDPSASDDYALRRASEGGHIGVVKLLLQAGVRMSGLSEALVVAVEKERDDVIRLLLETGRFGSLDIRLVDMMRGWRRKARGDDEVKW
ncbi:hypothetical protein HK101_008727 [Irineochytrium annulatum]|nr:hypothetical protein HK101_008727 [Irineochytrium annulatum]